MDQTSGFGNSLCRCAVVSQRENVETGMGTRIAIAYTTCLSAYGIAQHQRCCQQYRWGTVGRVGRNTLPAAAEQLAGGAADDHGCSRRLPFSPRTSRVIPALSA